LAAAHVLKVELMQKEYSYLIEQYGLAFDHSPVNITWEGNGFPVSLEVHKYRRAYLFQFDRCKEYLNSLKACKEKEEGILIISRIEQLLYGERKLS
jgi:hypothetical protein